MDKSLVKINVSYLIHFEVRHMCWFKEVTQIQQLGSFFISNKQKITNETLRTKHLLHGPVTAEEWTWWFSLLFSYSSCLWKHKDLTWPWKMPTSNVDMQDCRDDLPHVHNQHYWGVSHSGIVSWPKQSRCTKNLLIMPVYFFLYTDGFPLFPNFIHEIIGGISITASLKTPWLQFKR